MKNASVSPLRQNESALFDKFNFYGDINREEHSFTVLRFVVQLVFFGLIGALVGGLINYSIIKLQGHSPTSTSWGHSFWYVFLQLFFISAVAYMSIHFISRNFDDWIWSSFSGMMFWLIFISSQSRLMSNLSILVDDRAQ